MGVCDSIIKVLLITFNTICVLCGIAIIAVGGVLLANGGDFEGVLDKLDTDLQAPQITLIVLGSIIFIIAFLGCCGSIKENKCMLTTYAIFLIIIFIIQLAIGIYAAVTFDFDSVTNVVDELFKKQDSDSQAIFHDMERALECCGVRGITDYPNIVQLPSSCYPPDSNDILRIPYTEGCAQALDDWITNAGKVLAGVAIGLGVVEIVCAVLAIIQARSNKNMF